MKNQDNAVQGSNKLKTKGVAIVGLCILACKVPFLLALVGFGGLGATASMLDLPPLVKSVGITIGALGVAAVLGYIAYRLYLRSQAKSTQL